MKPLELKTRNAFEKDLKLAKKRGRNIKKLIAVVDDLQMGVPLAPKHRPHKLTGEWKGVMECHIEPDWLLVYEVIGDVLILLRTGTHSDLFE